MTPTPEALDRMAFKAATETEFTDFKKSVAIIRTLLDTVVAQCGEDTKELIRARAVFATPPPGSDTPTHDGSRSDHQAKDCSDVIESLLTQLAAVERERDEQKAKLDHLAKCVEISERINEGRTDAEVEAIASFDEAMALTVLETTEKERDAAIAERDAFRKTLEEHAKGNVHFIAVRSDLAQEMEGIVAERDALRREVEGLKKAVGGCDEMIEAANLKIAELEKDKARLDWLEVEARKYRAGLVYALAPASKPDWTYCVDPLDEEGGIGDSLRSAIDAAQRREDPAQGGGNAS